MSRRDDGDPAPEAVEVPEDGLLVPRLAALGGYLDLQTVATNNVHYAAASGHQLQDVLVCIRHLTNLTAAKHNGLLRPNSEF